MASVSDVELELQRMKILLKKKEKKLKEYDRIRKLKQLNKDKATESGQQKKHTDAPKEVPVSLEVIDYNEVVICDLQKFIEKTILQCIVYSYPEPTVTFAIMHSNGFSVIQKRECIYTSSIKGWEKTNQHFSEKLNDDCYSILYFNMPGKLMIGFANWSAGNQLEFILSDLGDTELKAVISTINVRACCNVCLCQISCWSFALLVTCVNHCCAAFDNPTFHNISFDIVYSKKKSSWILQLNDEQSKFVVSPVDKIFCICKDPKSCHEVLQDDNLFLLSCLNEHKIVLISESDSTIIASLSSSTDQFDISQLVWVGMIEGLLFLLLKNADWVLVVADIKTNDCHLLKTWEIESISLQQASTSNISVCFHDQKFYVVSSRGVMQILKCPDLPL